MKKLLLYILLLGAALILPLEGMDVGRLLPVELVQLDKMGDTVVISTDAGTTGTGKTVKAAIRDMEKTAAGIVFLDTADYLLVTESAMEEVESIKEHLKPSVRVCIQHVEMNLKDAAAYLSVHKPEHQLRSCQDPQSLQILTEESGKVILK